MNQAKDCILAIFLVLVFPLILEEVALVFLLTALTVVINVKAKPEANLKRRFNLSLMHPRFNKQTNKYTIKIEFKLLFETKMTKVYSKILLMKSSGSNFIFLLVFYLIMWVIKAPKNFGKIAILKI